MSEMRVNRGEEVGPGSRAVYNVLHGLVRLLVKFYFRATIKNPEAMPLHGPVIVAPVHRSNLDVPLTGALAKRRLRYMAKDTLYHGRFGNWFLTMLGGFPVERGTADREALKAAEAILERGDPLVLFPEGSRQDGPLVEGLFDGAAYLAAKTGAPILPVGIGGTEAAMPVGSRLIRPKRVAFVLADVIPAPVPPEGKSRVPRTELKRVTEELRERLQTAFDEAMATAGTPNHR